MSYPLAVRYFVIGEDGQKYGPAEISTLQEWIGEGRLVPGQQLEDEESGLRIVAGSLATLVFPGQNPQQYAGGAPYQQHYARPGAPIVTGNDGQGDITTAWVLGIIGTIPIVCCYLGPILVPLGLFFAYRAGSKGHPGAFAVKVYCWTVLSVVIICWMAWFVFGHFIRSEFRN